MVQEFIIREYIPSDRQAVMELLHLNIPAYFAPGEAADLEEYLDHRRELYYVIEYNRKVVGSGGINFSEDGQTGKISWDILHPAYQGQGLGKMLTHFRIKTLQAMPEIQTISVRTSQHVYRFYEKLGFILKEIVADYWAPGFDLYRMEQEA